MIKNVLSNELYKYGMNLPLKGEIIVNLSVSLYLTLDKLKKIIYP